MSLNIPAEQIDLTNLGHVKELIIEIDNEENIRRKKNAFIAFEALEGRQADHITDKLQALYPDTWQKFRVADVNITKKIILKKAKAYKNSPIRKLDKDLETEELERIYDKFKFNRAFKEADRIYNLHKYVALWLNYKDPEEYNDDILEGEYCLQALAPYEYDLVKDKYGKPVIFAFAYSGVEVTKGSDSIEQTIADDQRDTNAETKKYSFWSKNNFVRVHTRGKKDGKPYIEKIETKPNPIGRLPIAFLQHDTSTDYPIPSNLAMRSINWNVEMSDLRTSASTQGHGQLVIKAPETMKLRQLHMGMHTAITLPQSKKADDKPTEADYISASPNLGGHLDVLKFSLLQILDDEGITASSAIEGGVDQVKSGFDRVLKMADIQNVVEDNQELYSDFLEQGVYEILQAYEDALNSFRFSSEQLQITFEKPKVHLSDKETLDNLEKRNDLGLMLSHEKHMVINPNLTEEAAKEREELIQLEKQAKVMAMQSLIGDEELQGGDNGLQNEE
jgi:hypothetical protein